MIPRPPSIKNYIEKYVETNFIEYTVCELCGNLTKGEDTIIDIHENTFGVCMSCRDKALSIAKELFKSSIFHDI